MEEQKQISPYLIPSAIVLAGVLVAGSIFLSGSGGNSGTNNIAAVGGSAENSGGGEKRAPGNVDLEGDDPVLGSPDAPVTLVEFGDYECPFCARFFSTTEQEIIENYVKTGKVKFIYRDFPLTSIHGQAQKSAEASECANEQGKFWQYHDLLFERQSELGINNYKQWAKELGLNSSQFNDCLDSGKYEAEVQEDFRDGQAAGVTGTPANFVNGRLITGAVPFAQFKAVIEEELNK